jgi:hypothetical protein
MLQNTEGAITNGQSRETGNIWYTRRRKTQRNWQHMVHKTKKNTEKLATYGTQDEEKHRETGNIWYTRRRKQSKDTISFVLDTTMHKQTQIT